MTLRSGYILRRADQGGGWVATPGSASSYTKDPRRAALYPTKEAVEANRCGNEVVERFTYGIEAA